jgi:hypothetical protein
LTASNNISLADTAIARPAMLGCKNPICSLHPDVDYYFLLSPSWSKLVFLVEYVAGERRGKKTRRTRVQQLESAVVLHVISKTEFEKAVLDAEVFVKDPAPKLPPWLQTMTESEMVNIEEKRRPGVDTHSEKIDRRVELIYAAVLDINNILQSENPISSMNRFANSCDPVQNVTRFRCWVFTYLLFGRAGLHYSVGRIGKWDRKLKAGSSSEGGFSKVDHDCFEKIVQGYDKHRRHGRSMDDIYVKAMVDLFGCRTFKQAGGKRSLHQPDGLWYPSLRIFRYQIGKHLGQVTVSGDRKGKKKQHIEDESSKGSFTELVGNAYEHCEYDPFFEAARPRSVSSQEALPPLVVGSMRDGASGCLLAIGFDMGGETYDLYLATLFCAAIDKVKYCSLFGVSIEKEEWPMVGVPPKVILDRGAASAGLTRKKIRDDAVPEIELPPSGSGQSKALVETSHPKRAVDEEGPHHIVSDLNVFQMFRQQILRVVKFNDTANVEGRIPPEWLSLIDRPTPLILYNELTRRGRNDAAQISFERAVRTYLPVIQVRADKDNVSLMGRAYNCKELKKSSFFRRIGRHSIGWPAFHLRACVAHIWIDYEGQLYELELQFQVATHRNSKFLSLSDLQEGKTIQQQQARDLELHKHGMKAEMDERSKEATGVAMGAEKHKSGRIRKNRALVQEGLHSVAAVRGKA